MMNYKDIDTPALLIDETVLNKNLEYMGDYAKKQMFSCARTRKRIKCRI